MRLSLRRSSQRYSRCRLFLSYCQNPGSKISVKKNHVGILGHCLTTLLYVF